jgi:hypothetical protein
MSIVAGKLRRTICKPRSRPQPRPASIRASKTASVAEGAIYSMRMAGPSYFPTGELRRGVPPRLPSHSRAEPPPLEGRIAVQQAFSFTRVHAARRWVVAWLVAATAVAFAAPVGAAPNFTIEGLRVTPPIGQFGGVKLGSCDLQFLEGCRIRTFTLSNVGSEPILISGVGVESPAQDVTIGGSDCAELPLVEVDGQNYFSLAPGVECSATVGMAPLTVGRVERTFVVHGEKFDRILIVPLRAVGIAS